MTTDVVFKQRKDKKSRHMTAKQVDERIEKLPVHSSCPYLPNFALNLFKKSQGIE